ncbi:hypothetical protein BWI15_25335 [Kribbella sp. ALI-6-A]|uniref:hypothetical protein n=1 Tax=Kribbella sp. ALI-6-A TaxID=1933817 RepID=UPI00097C0469|nr:hypothetical protein [Kribbella sp. ALI-6-A]ONI69847.1 hypothetical protein BWI15_25335 [Kribbella sp. ALI-6-A]
MSDSSYHLVATGTDLLDAVGPVDRLLALNGADQVLVDVECETDTHALAQWLSVATADRTAAEMLLPPATAVEIEHLLVADGRSRAGVDGPDGVHLWVHPTDTAALDRLSTLPPFPVRVYVTELPPSDFSWDLIPPAPARTLVYWTDCWWPPAPGFRGESKHAGVALAVNASTLWDLYPGPTGFRAYVETRRDDVELARRLAAAAGLAVMAEPESL